MTENQPINIASYYLVSPFNEYQISRCCDYDNTNNIYSFKIYQTCDTIDEIYAIINTNYFSEYMTDNFDLICYIELVKKESNGSINVVDKLNADTLRMLCKLNHKKIYHNYIKSVDNKCIIPLLFFFFQNKTAPLHVISYPYDNFYVNIKLSNCINICRFKYYHSLFQHNNMLSTIPNEILVHIISFIPTKNDVVLQSKCLFHPMDVTDQLRQGF